MPELLWLVSIGSVGGGGIRATMRARGGGGSGVRFTSGSGSASDAGGGIVLKRGRMRASRSDPNGRGGAGGIELGRFVIGGGIELVRDGIETGVSSSSGGIEGVRPRGGRTVPLRRSSKRKTGGVRTRRTRPPSSVAAKSIGQPTLGKSTRPPSLSRSSVAMYWEPTMRSGTFSWVRPGTATAHRHTPSSSSMKTPDRV